MGTCRYCEKNVKRLSATICKKCFDEVFRYEESVKWFERTQMKKHDYYKELMSIAVTPTIKRHFQLESDGLIDHLNTKEGEEVLAVIRNVKYEKEIVVEGDEKSFLRKNGEARGWHIQRTRRDTGYLIITTDRLVLLGRSLKLVKEFSELEEVEDYDGLGIALPASAEINGEIINLRQYLYPFVDYRYLIRMIFEFSKVKNMDRREDVWKEN